jgi:hypothetical protein
LKDPDNHNHLIIDPYAAEIVQRIFVLYISGIGKTRIGSILSEEGILIPSDYKVKMLKQNYHNANAIKTTKLWSYQTIHQILNNEVYLGHTVQNKCQSLSYKSKHKKAVPKEQWIKVENTHEAIIDEDTWNLAKEISKTKSKVVNADDIVGLFAGKLFCGNCEHAMVRYYSSKNEFTGYYCKTYKQYGNKFCSSHTIKDQELQEIVLDSIKEEAKKILTDEDLKELFSFRIYENSSLDIKKNIKNLELKKENIGRYKQRSYENYVDNIITKEEFLNYKKIYNNEEVEIDDKITKLNNELL